MPDYFNKTTYKYNPLIVDAIVECLTNYLYSIVYADQKEINSQSEGTGLYRILPNASDDIAFRKRVQTTRKSYPILPFTNFRWYDIDEDSNDKYSSFGFNQGLIDELYQMKIKIIPSMLVFQSTSWVSGISDTFTIRKLFQKERSKRKIKLSLNNYLKINRQKAPLNIFVEFEKPDISKYSDISWLESNKINAVSHAFTVRYMDLVLDPNVNMVDSFELEVVSAYDNWESEEDYATDLPVIDDVNVTAIQAEEE